MTANPYEVLPATITDIVTETPTIKTFFIQPERPLAFRAGQFVELSLPGVGEAPFTPSSSPAVSDRLELTIMRVGSVTERLHAVTPGTRVGLRGPLGQPYPLDRFRGKEVLIVGGGVGLAPLRALLFALLEDLSRYRKVLVRYGAKTPNDIVYKKAILDGWGRKDALDILVTVDTRDATWPGHEGVVTTILEPGKLTAHPADGVSVVCGPPIMMKFTTLKLLSLGYAPENIYLSMEKNMSCGIGKCGHCRLGTYYACKDGPVFTYAMVKDLPNIWD